MSLSFSIAGATSQIVVAYAANHELGVDEVPLLVRQVSATLSAGPDLEPVVPVRPPKPAVPIKTSVQRDYIVCLEDGKKLKMLKRYLRARFNLSPDEYRRRWGLSPDYPMVAPAYAERRSDFAKHIGLGKRMGNGRS